MYENTIKTLECHVGNVCNSDQLDDALNTAIELMRKVGMTEAAELMHCTVLAMEICPPFEYGDEHRAVAAQALLRERAAVRAECAAKMDELSGAYAKERDEAERLKAQLSGVGMQEFRRLEGRLHNAQAEIERLTQENRRLHITIEKLTPELAP